MRIAKFIVAASLHLLVGLFLPAASAAGERETEAQEASLLHRQLDLGAVRLLDTSKGKWGPLKHERGKVLVVHLWAVECAPCVSEMPLLKNIAKGWRTEAEVRFYMVSETLDEKVIKDFWFHTYKDKVPDTALAQSVDDRIRETLGTNKQPITLLLDSNLVVRQAFIGTLHDRAGELAEGISRLLKVTNRK